MRNIVKTLLFVLFMSGTHGMYAQNQVIIDFKKLDTVVLPTTISVGEQYVVEIQNINLNLYKVSINSKDSVFSKALETPTFGNLSLDALNSAVAAIGSFGTSFVQEIKTLELESGQNKIMFGGFPPMPSVSDEIMKKLKKEQAYIDQSTGELKKISESIDEFKLSVYKTRLSAYRISGAKEEFDFDMALKKLDDLREELDSIDQVVLKRKGEFEKYIEAKKAEINTSEELKKARDSITKAFGAFVSATKEGKAILSADNANTLLSSIVFLENNRGMRYRSMPIQFKGEQAQLTVKITPREEKFLLQSYETTYEFPARKNTYVKLGLSFYFSNLHDEAYSVVGTPVNDSTNTYQVLPENYSTNEIGIVSFIRFGWKIESADWFGGHFAFGPGMSISNNVKPRILYGGGITLGKKHMCAIDFGAATGYVDRLSAQLQVGTDLPEKPSTVTVTRLDTQLFVALGYVFMF